MAHVFSWSQIGEPRISPLDFRVKRGIGSQGDRRRTYQRHGALRQRLGQGRPRNPRFPGQARNQPLKEVCGSFSAFPDVGWALDHVLPRSDSRLSAIPKAAGHRFVFGRV
jgi:hypothetical protein